MTTKTQPALVHQRWMIRRDYAEVLEIESFNAFAWTEEVFLHHLRKRNIIGMVAHLKSEDGDEGDIVGFMVYALEKTHLACLNFAVHPQWRRLGVGRQMIEKLVGKLASHRRTRITVNVHESNLDMQLFLRAMGFQATRIEGEFYRMVRRLADAPAIHGGSHALSDH